MYYVISVVYYFSILIRNGTKIACGIVLYFKYKQYNNGNLQLLFFLGLPHNFLLIFLIVLAILL